ncbi:sulfurtransferase TusE [Luminiphilus syltensis NOR5-1B]|uniref:Sulfurtransferase n=2 Tax=Luminiphilus TaxID=1341118 RepID=B8KQS8_9GAMM|nr:sulfurtransferase TusE [Luminiphilus syltensis NOR5-1B]
MDLCDDNGFLADRSVWSTEIATEFAALEDIVLSEAHWEILHLLRAFYDQYDDSPANRALVNYVKRHLGAKKGNSLYLMSLFPGSPARVGSRIAGLPKPKNCL